MAFTSGIPAALQPTQTKALYAGNYIDFTDSSFNMWAQQFLPDVYEQEVERYGNRSIGSFLRMVSAEMPSTSDQIIWTEQGRLHTRYANIVYLSNSGTMPTSGTTPGTASAATTGGNVGNFFVPTAQPTSLGVTTQGTTAVNFKKGQTVMIQAQTSATSAIGGTGAVIKGVVTNVSGQYFQIKSYGGVPAITNAQRFTALAYGSEFAKGSGNFSEKLDPSYATFTNSPVILKEHYSINGSDTAQIGWIEVTSENGASGYLWYLKSEHENRLRFEDYLEMSMVEGVKQLNTGATLNFYDSALTATAKGTEGFFEAIEARGNVYSGFGAQAGGGGGALTDFDAVLVQLDKQGAIEENMLFLDRNLSLEIDDILAQQNGGYSGGTSFGVFNNSEDMALNLGFTGYRRGSYDFYKTDWKYLNDFSTRGGFGDIEGVLVPAGTSTVYDQVLGQNIKRPFLHIRYRASETENRKMKSWVTGSVGGPSSSPIDEMRMHYLSERCLIVQGANNFVLFKDA
tara:strand:- start:9454 stop:10989 length:1536 start_codon:yes stop_codon:yes gene_type:complete